MAKHQPSFKYRIYPTKEQEAFLAQQFGCIRYVYNHFLNRRQTEWQQNKRSLNLAACSKELPLLKQELPWLKDVNAQSLQASVKHLDRAYINFFEKRASYPQPKKKRSEQCIKIPQAFAIEGKHLFIPKLKSGIRIRMHKQIVGRVVALFIRNTAPGKYYASFTTAATDITPLPPTDNKLAFDLGLIDLLTFSNGDSIPNPRWQKRLKRKLYHLHRQLSRKQKGSSNRNRARHQLALCYEQIKNNRINLIHQITSKMVNENQVIVSETLAVKNMMRNHCLADSIQDASWGEIVRQLDYKSEWNGRTYVKINRFFPSSKTCSHCKQINHDLQLGDRKWVCPSCGTVHKRDHNSAINLLEEGLKQLHALGQELISEPKPKLATASKSKRKKALSSAIAMANYIGNGIDIVAISKMSLKQEALSKSS